MMAADNRPVRRDQQIADGRVVREAGENIVEDGRHDGKNRA